MSSIGCKRIPAANARPAPAAVQPTRASGFSFWNGHTRPKSRASERWPFQYDTKTSHATMLRFWKRIVAT
jgi:hypothetical protein